MGILTFLLETTVVVGGVVLYVGPKGLKRWSRSFGRLLGTSVAQSRLHRSKLQKELVETQSVEQREAAARLQRNLWQLRMVMNEVTMVRSFSPRLLHKGNYGFTDQEMLEALGVDEGGVSNDRRSQMDAHADHQFEMEGRAISDPHMFPLAAQHGSVAEVPAMREQLPATPKDPTTVPDRTVSDSSSSVQSSGAGVGPSGAPGAAAEREVPDGWLAPAEVLDESVRHHHWSNWEASMDGLPDGVIIPSSPAAADNVPSGTALSGKAPSERDTPEQGTAYGATGGQQDK